MDSAREPGAGSSALQQALDRMWIQFLPMMTERVAILETAATAIAENQLSIEQREAAHGAAHKLAGALGTFGLNEGTLLAREAEALYLNDQPDSPPNPARLTEIAARLRTLIENRG
jgi:HPt (histidine-containing phosphotransfer) domain-containing protein